MQVIDTHCDTLYQLQQNRTLCFTNDKKLQTNLERLKRGNVKVIFMAIFLKPTLRIEERWQAAVEQVHIFQEKIVENHPEIVHIKEWKQLEQLEKHEIGVVLTLEGAEAIGNDLTKLETLFTLGVRSVGLTWNDANLCADGILEPRGAGLTLFGKKVVQQNNKHRILTDVAHISEKGFWEVIELAKYPFSSHANAKAICHHPRNLTDAQLHALIKKEAPIHILFYPPFISDKNKVSLSHLLHHLDHICSLGGEKQIGFGSDFDGMDQVIPKLSDASMYPNFINELLKRYPEELVRGFCYENFERYVRKNHFL